MVHLSKLTRCLLQEILMHFLEMKPIIYGLRY